MAEKAAATWLAEHPEGLKTELHGNTVSLKSLEGHLGSLLNYEDGKWMASIGFNPAITKGSSLAEVRNHFAWIALDRCGGVHAET